MRRCFLFPGQGAQFPGMGKDIYDSHPEVHELYTWAEEAAGFDVAALSFDGSEDDLKATDKSQVCITVTNLAARRLLAKRGITSDAAAGFSLGEYAALVDADVLSEQDAITLVTARGRIMERVSRSLDSDSGSPGMAAVVGIEYTEIEAALSKTGVAGVYPANLNSPTQTVLSGTAAGLEAATPVLKEAGARRVIQLKVSGPFHSPLMKAARDEFEKVLQGASFSNPGKTVYSNVTGVGITSGEQARLLCAEQLIQPVRWVDEMALIAQDGYEELLEVGPGTVLGGLWKAYKKSNPDVTIECRAVGTVEQIEEIS